MSSDVLSSVVALTFTVGPYGFFAYLLLAHIRRTLRPIPKDAEGFGLVRDVSGALSGTYQSHSVRLTEDADRRRWWTLVLSTPVPFRACVPRSHSESPNERSNSTGDSMFDAAFAIEATTVAAPAHLDRPTRDLLVGLLERFSWIIIQGTEVRLGSPDQSASAGLEALARIAERLSVDVVPALSRIALDEDEPTTLRVWAFRSLVQTADANAARAVASVLIDDRHPAIRVRAAIVLGRPDVLRTIAMARVLMPISIEAIDALAAFPDPENRSVVLHALGEGTGQVMVSALALARPSGMDARTLVASSDRVTSDPAVRALCEILRALADPAATGFLLGRLEKVHTPSTSEAIFRALGACASSDALPRLLEVADTLPPSGVRHECKQAIARIRARLRETDEPGRLSVAIQDSGELTFAMDAGALSPADEDALVEHVSREERSPAPRD